MKPIIQKMRIFFGLEKPPRKTTNKTEEEEEEDQEETTEPEQIGYMNDVVKENEILNDCGSGLSQEEAYLISVAIKNFNIKTGSTKTIFWGKIFGLKKNYYVLQAEIETEGNDEENLNLEVK